MTLKMKKPTEAELELLSVLWECGPSTVRQIHESLQGEKATAYTTTLKILQKMTDKGLVLRDETQYAHIYSAAAKPEQTQRQLVSDLLQRAFGGSPGRLVIQALSEKPASSEELAEIRKLLDDLDQQQNTEETLS